MSYTRLLRRKSGEAVRSAIRPSSPSPRPIAKAVHFSENLEQARHFLQSDCTASIRVGSPNPDEGRKHASTLPTQSNIPPCRYTRWTVTLNSYHESSRHEQLVQLHDFDLCSKRQSLVGDISVANIAFEKRVSARFTVDDWQTVSEVIADYEWPKNNTGAYDRFSFAIALPPPTEVHAMTMIVCIRYQVNGEEYWDNNSGKNYLIHLSPEKRQEACEVAAYSSPGGHPESRLSERYNMTTTLGAADELAKCDSSSAKFTAMFGSPPALIAQETPGLDFGSSEYMNMIETLCYFKPSGRLSDNSQLIHCSSVALDENAAYCSKAQSSPRIHCF